MVLEGLLEQAVSKRTVRSQTRRELLDHLDFTEKQLQLVTVEMKDKICKMVEEVEHKVQQSKDQSWDHHFVDQRILRNTAIGDGPYLNSDTISQSIAETALKLL